MKITFVAEIVENVPAYMPIDFEIKMPWFENYVNSGGKGLVVKEILSHEEIK